MSDETQSNVESLQELQDRIIRARCGKCICYWPITDEYGRCCVQPPLAGGSIMQRIGQVEDLRKLVNSPTTTPDHFCGSFVDDPRKSLEKTMIADRVALSKRKQERAMLT